MRIVAVAASHLARSQRVAGNAAGFGSFGFMAAKTHAGLLGFLAYRVLGAVQGVAGCTGQAFTLVATSAPVAGLVRRMAAQAGVILGRCRGWAAFAGRLAQGAEANLGERTLLAV